MKEGKTPRQNKGTLIGPGVIARIVRIDVCNWSLMRPTQAMDRMSRCLTLARCLTLILSSCLSHDFGPVTAIYDSMPEVMPTEEMIPEIRMGR